MMRLHPQTRRKASRSGEQGYILLTLLLIMALMAIVALAAMPTLKFNRRRDREEEMIHRGAQYSNAIRRFYKKFGRYPTKIEDLENSNSQRFLRKRYKDPMNCKAGKCEDFKLLHFGDVQMSISGFGGGVIPGANAIGATGGLNGTAGLGQTSGFGQNSSFGGNSSFGQNSSFGGNSSFGANSTLGQNQPQNPGNQPLGSDPTQTGTQNSPGAPPGNGTDPGTASSSSSSSSSSGNNQLGSGQIIGGPIVGVASATKDTDPTIREFNHKKKYKDWMFVYDPAQDQGRLITTPYQPQMQGLGQGMQNVNGINGGAGSGQPLPGMQNNPNLPASGGFGNSNQPGSPPQ
jgi:type II secretory pathway pseudopilin PulG